jgi:hypothetical protein
MAKQKVGSFNFGFNVRPRKKKGVASKSKKSGKARRGSFGS